MKTYETDVLVVGGGGAATAATISAHERGARTMMAVKGRFGVPGVRGAGATSNPRGDFWTIRTVGKKGGFFNPPDLVLRDMVQIGLGMADPELCEIFVNEVSEAIKRLREMGMRFQSRMLATMPADEVSRTNHIVQVQKAVIEGTNTQVVENANFTNLLVQNGRVTGAMGIHDDAEPFVVRAGAVVMATGGVGQLFKYSFNPPGNTGDGYAMALRAGAQLFNMEFIQQGLATTWPEQAMVMLYEMEEPYRLFNKHGKTFVEGYLPEGVTLDRVSKEKAFHWPVSCRDSAIHLDRAIHGEAVAGRATENDGVFLDLRGSRRGFQPEVFIEYMHSIGINVENDVLQVQVHHHTSNGGLRVNVNGASTIPGLFAAGETMGWQGADRLGGTMLGGSQVFGWRAGGAAAEAAKDRDEARSAQSELEAMLLEPLARIKESKGTRSLEDMKDGLQRAMWRLLLVERSAEKLAAARQFVAEERDRLHYQVALRSPFDCALAFEHENLLDVAEVILESADLRTESRGSHYRSDFPTRNDADWLTNLFASKQNGKLLIEKKWINRERGWEDQPDDVRIMPWG